MIRLRESWLTEALRECRSERLARLDIRVDSPNSPVPDPPSSYPVQGIAGRTERARSTFRPSISSPPDGVTQRELEAARGIRRAPLLGRALDRRPRIHRADTAGTAARTHPACRCWSARRDK